LTKKNGVNTNSYVRQVNINNEKSISEANRKKKKKQDYRPVESRIAVSGYGTYKKTKRRRGAAKGRKGSWLNPVAIVMVSVILIASLGGGLGYAIWYNSFTEVKLSDYTQVVITGYDNYGEADLSVLSDGEHREFFDTVSASIDTPKSLSNGDEIEVTYSYDEELAKENKLRIDDSSTSITVEGLKEATVIDKDTLFAGLNVTFDGLSPCIAVTCENTSTDEFLSGVVYSVAGEKQFFSNGEEVTIHAEVDSSLLGDDNRYVLKLSEDDYNLWVNAPTGDSYFEDAGQVTDEILSELEKEGFNLISKSDAKEYGLRIFQQEAHIQPVFVGNTTTFKWVNPYVISAYFHSVTEDGKQFVEIHANDVQIVYGVTITQQDGKSCLAEMVIQFVNLVAKEDGTYDLNLDSGRIVSASYKNSNIKKLVSGGTDGMYTTTKLTE